MSTVLAPKRCLAAAILVAASVVVAGCGGGGGGAGGSTTPRVLPTVSLEAQPLILAAGGTTTLTWSSTNANSCTASGGWSGPRATSGSEAITAINTDTRFAIECRNVAETAAAQVTVTVLRSSDAPPTVNLKATPSLVRNGGVITLTWTSTNADSCYPSWPVSGMLPPSGTATFPAGYPGARQQFTLQCSGPGGTTSVTVTVDVQTLMGELVIPSGIFVDGDVNDPEAGYYPNDRLNDAMPVPSLGFVPGYVNQPFSGPQGRSYEIGDQQDFYRASTMLEGQIVRLVMPTVDVNAPADSRDDADLYLWDIDGRLIDAAIGSGATEVLRIPQEAPYVIEVRSVHGGMNYLLSLEDPTSPAVVSQERLSAAFVPNEAIVLLDKQASGSAAAAAIASSVGYSRIAGEPGREMRVGLGSATRTQSNNPRAATTVARDTAGLSPGDAAKISTLLGLKALRMHEGVRAASLNRIVEATAVPADPLYPRQKWHYSAASLPLAWDTTTGSSKVIVAVVDTGMVVNHPDLAGKFVDGYDFVSDPQGMDGDGIDGDYSDPGYEIGGQWIFHGTHVAGTVGASANNGVGGVGVASGARLMPLRVLDGSTGTEYDELQAVRYAAGLANDSGRIPAKRADIINLSLSSPEQCSAVSTEVYRLVAEADVSVVASAGNYGSNTPTNPASCPGVISVGATGPTSQRTFYSNYGPYVSLMAPGGNMASDLDFDGYPDGVYSTSGQRQVSGVVPGYDWLEGTSMAAPHVSGVLALMKSVNPSLSASEIQLLLEAGFLTDDTGVPGRDDDGYGTLNAARAMQAALGNFPSAPRLSAKPGALNFSSYWDDLTFSLQNAGSGVIRVDSVTASAPWAVVTPINVNGAGLGTYRVTVSRAGLAHGIHYGAVDVASSAGPLSIALIMTKWNYGVAPRLGAVRVRVADADTGSVLRETTIKLTYDRTLYQFDDVPLGRVVVTAGTDMNNDGNVCDPGEVCGAFPNGTVPVAIDYTGVRTAVDIPFILTALAPTGL